MSGRRWPANAPRLKSARSAKCAVTRWPCCHSAATTWPTTSVTGWTWVFAFNTSRGFFTSTGSALTNTAGFSGRVSARTCASSSGCVARCRNEVAGVPTPIGYVPDPKDIDMTGLKLSSGTMNKLLAVDRKAWMAELDSIKEFFDQFDVRLPDQLWAQHEALRQRLRATKQPTRSARQRQR